MLMIKLLNINVIWKSCAKILSDVLLSVTCQDISNEAIAKVLMHTI